MRDILQKNERAEKHTLERRKKSDRNEKNMEHRKENI